MVAAKGEPMLYSGMWWDAEEYLRNEVEEGGKNEWRKEKGKSFVRFWPCLVWQSSDVPPLGLHTHTLNASSATKAATAAARRWRWRDSFSTRFVFSTFLLSSLSTRRCWTLDQRIKRNGIRRQMTKRIVQINPSTNSERKREKELIMCVQPCWVRLSWIVFTQSTINKRF